VTFRLFFTVPSSKASGVGKSVENHFLEKPTYMFGGNRNARGWAIEDMTTDGNRMIDRKYSIVGAEIKARTVNTTILRPCLPATGATPQISRPVLGALMRWGARESYRRAIAGLLL
jgi:hypothetical protein